jgi:hypothetical protein
MQADFPVNHRNSPSLSISNEAEKKDIIVDGEKVGLQLLAAAENGDLNELKKSLEIAEQHPDKISHKYLGKAMVLLGSDKHIDGLQLLLHSPRINEVEIPYFETLAINASNKYQLNALEALVSSERAKDLSPDILGIALCKNTESERCLLMVIRKILALDNAKKIKPSELGTALRNACDRLDYLAVHVMFLIPISHLTTFSDLMLLTPVSDQIPQKDIAYGFCRSLFLYRGTGLPGDFATPLWQSAKDEAGYDYLFNEALEYHRDDETKLEKLMRIAIDKISLGCLGKAVSTYLIENFRVGALQVVLKSKKAQLLDTSVYEEALTSSCRFFQFEGMKALICSNIATRFSPKSLLKALSFLALPKTPEFNHLKPETAETITREILKLPKAADLKLEQLQNIIDKATEPVKDQLVRPETEGIIYAILDSALWAKLN